MSLEWNRLRSWNGSQAAAFEELVCQLASYEPTPSDGRFIRKGVPDAGVECFWSLVSVAESIAKYGWQAKFFTSAPSAGQWKQVDSSVETALDKHPNLIRYTVAMAIDRSDARTKRQKSCLGHWHDHVKKWETWARAKDMHVEFHFWGTHEIAERLSRDEHCGRFFFWFSQELFSPQWFRDRLDEAIAIVGPRYTPELNVHLPVSAVFDGLSRSPEFLQRFRQAYGGVGKAWPKGSLRDLENDLPDEIEKFRQQMDEIIELSKSDCVSGVDCIDWSVIQKKTRDVRSLLSDIQRRVYDLARKKKEKESAVDGEKRHYHGENSFGFASQTLQRIEEQLTEFLSFTESDVAQLANTPFFLLVGKAGTGKTHLFSDATRQHVAAGAPAVLLIGSQFRDEEPWGQILRILNLSCTRDEFLGALETAAQLAGRRAVIFVDALNEGNGRSLWTTYLPCMIEVMKRYPWVALAVSVRSSYEKLVVPDGLLPDKMTRSVHEGFADQEYEAAKAYFDFYGIELPAVPILTPEFQNPLFLKCFCKGLYNRGLTKIPTGIHGISSVFEFFLNSVNEKLASPDFLDYDEKDNLVQQAVDKIASSESMATSSLITRAEAKKICDQLLLRQSYEQSLFRHLLSEGILAERVEYDGSGQHEEVILFSYERLADHLIMCALLAKHVDPDNPAKAFLSGQPLGRLFDGFVCLKNQGLAEALAIQGPEMLDREIFELLPEVRDVHSICEAFIESLLWRDPRTISDQCLPYIKQYIAPDESLRHTLLNTLLTLAPNPEHPFNADFLHHHLIKREMAERDAWWSTFLYKEYDEKGSVDRLIDWAWSEADKKHITDDSIRLTGKALIWFLTTSHRFLRDRATKALVALFTDRIGILCRVLPEFVEVNDPYVAERLYAMAYGCALRSNKTALKRQLAEVVYKLVFKDGSPPCHILLRDYARGVIEVALRDGLSFKGFDLDKIRPPYRSEWPLDSPSESDVKKYREWSKDMSDKRCAFHSLYSSVMECGDFARYILGSDGGNLRWSKRRLNKPRIPSRKEQYDAFEASLTERQKSAWNGYLNVRHDVESYGQPETDRRKKAFGGEFTEEELQGVVDQAMRSFLQTLGTKKASLLQEVVLPYLDASPSDKDEFALPVSIAQQWIIKRVVDLGWTVERFGDFDRDYPHADTGRQADKPERIGKKYQWLAYHELLAHMADNLEFREDTGSQKPDEYVGPWQLGLRDIDPSCLLRSTQCSQWKPNTSAWWASVKFEDWAVEPDEVQWRKRIDLLPAIVPLPIVIDPETEKEWFVLDCLYEWEEPTPPEKDRFGIRHRYICYRLKSYLVKAGDEERFYKWGLGQHFMDESMPKSHAQTDICLGEFFWAPAFEYFNDPYYGRDGWTRGNHDSLPCEVLVPTNEYMQERGCYDCSIDKTIIMYLPTKVIADQMSLSWRGVEGCYFNLSGKLVAQDPSVKSPGPQAFLVDRNLLSDFLQEHDYRLIWTLLGEKDIRGGGQAHDENWPGRMELSGCMRMKDNRLEGSATAYWVTKGPNREELNRMKIA